VTPATDTHRAIDAVWRIESARLIAGLARIVRDIGRAEELAQDALVAALEQWPESGVPNNPGAWLMATAKHRALDHLRRTKLLERKHAELERMRLLEETAALTETLNNVGAIVASDLDRTKVVQAVTDAATELTTAQFGAFFYNVTDAGGESYTLYTISGVPREAFAKFPMPRNTEVFEPTFKGTGIVRSADITKDPRYGHNAPYHGMPPGHLPVRSYLAVPVKSQTGEVLGGLFFGHSDAGVFDERAERLVGFVSRPALTDEQPIASRSV